MSSLSTTDTGTRSLDLGSGPQPKNPFGATHLYGVDIRKFTSNQSVLAADLVVEPIPFPNDSFHYVTAFDFIEHMPRVIYAPMRRNSFVELMNEVYRVLMPGGLFMSSTPAYPKAAVFRDPTHVNVITEETFTLYFDDRLRWAEMYGFNGRFKIESQYWHENGINLDTIMRKV